MTNSCSSDDTGSLLLGRNISQPTVMEAAAKNMASSYSSDETGSAVLVRNISKPSSPVNSYSSLKFNRLERNQALDAAEAPGQNDPALDVGFARPDMHSDTLVGSVTFYERHVFLCYKDAQSWPPRVEAADFDRLPRHLVAALRARRNDMPKKTKLTICEGRDGTDSCNGDVFIFPDMLKYRSLTHFDVDTFVEEVLVKGKEWNPGKPEHLTGSHVFVCAHSNRDARCGHCGPILVQKFKEEIVRLGLKEKVFVWACSHIGGHKYAGNVIVYTTQIKGGAFGHWYGYVTPEDIGDILQLHIAKGQIVERLWRGAMGLREEEQKQAQQNRLAAGPSNICQDDRGEGCACSAKESKCCLDGSEKKSSEVDQINPEPQSRLGTDFEQISSNSKLNLVDERGLDTRWPDRTSRIHSSWRAVISFIETWEHEDTFVALAVIGAAVSAGMAYRLYKMTI